MTHNYHITGMTCSGCESKVKNNLLLIPEVTAAEVSKDKNAAIISMSEHVSLSRLQEALGGGDSKYQIHAQSHHEVVEETKSFFRTYLPVILILFYISMVSLIASWQNGVVEWQLFMRFFMAGFFLSFSFFKLINLQAFADSYAMYDVVAKKFRSWGFIYAFMELGLGILFLADVAPILTNWITLIVMSVSIIGVSQSVLNKKKIRCACLGAVFNLPMSTLTIVEDLLMIGMSATMLIFM